MENLFLDQKKTLHTCKEEDCKNCNVSKDINCHFNLKQLLNFLLIALPPFIIGGYTIYTHNWIFLAIWIVIILLYFGLVEIRVMCSHCPHYAEPKLKTLKCWANYGAPKLWKYRPGPMSIAEKTIFLFGMSVAFLYPIIFLVIVKEWFLLFICIMTTIAFFATLKNFLCAHCINFACPFNTVDNDTRNKFFDKNVVVKQAWKKED